MDKFDFINRIIALYPHAIADKQAQYDTYNRVLSKKVDYEQLMNVFANEYTDKFPPPAAILKEMSQKCIKYELKNAQQWLKVKVFNPVYNCEKKDCFPAGTTQEQMLNAYRKKFPGVEGFKIIEVC